MLHLQQLSQAEQANHTLVDRFKLLLQPPAYASSTSSSSGSVSMQPVHLPPKVSPTMAMADFLCGLRKFILATLKSDAGTSAVTQHDRLLWCLTVPAVWDEPAKAEMRSAAVRAGLISDANSDHLMLIVEPEAAALAAKVRTCSISAELASMQELLMYTQF